MKIEEMFCERAEIFERALSVENSAPNKNKVFSFGRTGFTLIELLITIGIILVLTAALIPSFNSIIQTQHVKVAQQQVKDDVRNLVSKGFTYNNSGTEYLYYGLIIESNMARTYKFFTSQVASGCPPSDMVVVGKGNDLSSDVGLSVVSLPYCVKVNVLNPDTISAPTASSPSICTDMPFCINIKPVNTSIADCYAVGFNLYGGIKTFQGACP